MVYILLNNINTPPIKGGVFFTVEQLPIKFDTFKLTWNSALSSSVILYTIDNFTTFAIAQAILDDQSGNGKSGLLEALCIKDLGKTVSRTTISGSSVAEVQMTQINGAMRINGSTNAI